MEEGLRHVFKGELRGRHVETIRIEKHRVKIKEEADLLKLDHPNILRLVPCGNDNDYMYFALELCVGSLNQLFLISDDAQKYSGSMPHHIDALLQLASGLEYIHSKNLVHGNIKPENVLISMGSAGQDETTLKWANFGLTRNIDELGRGRTSPVRENKAWLAPELLSLKLNSTADKREYQETIQSDIFAQGLVFASLLLKGEHLYGSINHENQIPDNIIGRNAINMQKIDGKLRDLYENDLLKKMLKNDPKERMTSTEVVDQLTSIKTQLIEKERELLKLCGSDSRLDVTEKIKNLIQFGINLNAKDNGGRNALHLLCRYYSSSKLSAAIKLVIEGGINVNARDPDGLNAIHSLCRYHSSQNLIDSIQILIQSGIDTTAKTNDGSTTLHYLCRYNSSPHIIDAVEILTKLEVNLMEKDGSGRSAFYYSHFKDTEMKISFDRKKQIGRGSFSVVFKGMFKGREVAVKRVEIHHVDGREEEPMLKLHHRNIVRLLHCEKDDDFRYYALELCVASLDQLFLKSDNPKKYDGPMPRQIVVFSQLAKGLAYIHSERLIHREIKPSNILIMQCPGKYQEIIIKWSDFGLSKSVNEKGLHSWTGVRGTRTWYAPEVLKKLINGKKAEQEEFWGTVQSDVFVLGLVFGYLFLMGEHLYGSSETEIHKNIIKKKPVNMQKIDEKLHKYYEDDLLMKMLEHDPKKRITSKEVVEQLESINNKVILCIMS
ncbi:hypothetical protein OUZ56_020553 [Daphnia magna]|uniref:Protein kinase domain-containing protein n=1 Tax=Daphnia magna TaxID=35525 RepID=A0ABQ9ZER9_9CRUS|nr:hypothetical protein OUZ56_020553 [Daphnia magna]